MPESSPQDVEDFLEEIGKAPRDCGLDDLINNRPVLTIDGLLSLAEYGQITLSHPFSRRALKDGIPGWVIEVRGIEDNYRTVTHWWREEKDMGYAMLAPGTEITIKTHTLEGAPCEKRIIVPEF